MYDGDSLTAAPAVSFDGGDLDCGSGLLLLIRRHIDPLSPGELLEIFSNESSVEEDLPAWCRLTGNELVRAEREGQRLRFLVCKGRVAARAAAASEPAPRIHAAAAASPVEMAVDAAHRAHRHAPITQPVADVIVPSSLPSPSPAAPLEALAVGGVGSWPRPRWLLRALHERMEGRLSEQDFEAAADDAARLAIAAQQRAGATIVTDGEQRRDNYASFVGARLDNCQLIPITDLLPYVDDPEQFANELRALDVPAAQVRHPAVFGPLGRSRPLAVQEFEFARAAAPGAAIKIALPGPYLLTRTMWMECISDRAYSRREDLAIDIVRVLREELHFLLAAGASIVQLDEPVLSEVVYGASGAGGRTFMCGALGARRPVDEELAFARDLLGAVVEGLPRERLALHVCRGNWTPDESVALAGDYRPLLPVLGGVAVGTLFLELCTPRAGELEVLAALPGDIRVGVGVINQKEQRVESIDEVLGRAERAIALFGPERVLLNPDCGFATFADNPIVTAELAEHKLAVIAQAAEILRARHHS